MSRSWVLLFVAFTLPSTSAWSVTLVEEGKAQCVIVVPLEEQTLLDAAEDLRYHLQKMSGANVPIIHDPTKVKGVAIYIDTKPNNVHVPGRVFDRSVLWPDGYVIEVIQFDGKTGVFLSSPVAEGVRNAIYGLLEDHLGCRWFTMGSIGEHIPRRRTVTLDIPGNRVIAKPTFEKRGPWYNGNANRYLTREEIAELNRWYRRNRRGEPRGTAGHGWHLYKPDELKQIDEDGDGISDLAPVVDGKRDPAQTGNGLCMSHPKAVDIAARWFIDFFNARPEFDHWSFSQGDSMQFCECERCQAFGSNHGAHMLILSNRVIQRVNKVHPGKRITIMPYQATLEPPKEQLQANPNLNPIIVSMGVDQISPKPESPQFRRQVERWMTMLPRAWSYDYISWTSGPWPLFQALEQTRDFYRAAGYTGVMDEYLGRNLGTDIHLWLSLKLAWNGDLRVKDLLDEFYPTYYGAAAKDLRRVYERIENQMLSIGPVTTSMTNIPRLYPPELVDECLADLAQAKRKVAGDPTLVARVERDENCLKATRLWLRFWTILGEANRKLDRQARVKAAGACRAYLDFFNSLNGTLTLGGGGMHVTASRMASGLEGSGTYFAKGSGDQPWPGPFRYYDFLDQGGKVTDAKSITGFSVGPHGLYLKPRTAGEIVYDFRTTEDLVFAEAHFPGPRAGYQVALALALPNKIEVSLDQGTTWSTAYEDLDTSVPFYQHDMTPHVRGHHQFLLKFSVENTTDKEILAFDKWVIAGKTSKKAEKQKRPRKDGP